MSHHSPMTVIPIKTPESAAQDDSHGQKTADDARLGRSQGRGLTCGEGVENTGLAQTAPSADSRLRQREACGTTALSGLGPVPGPMPVTPSRHLEERALLS